jgi:hypothetical protein
MPDKFPFSSSALPNPLPPLRSISLISELIFFQCFFILTLPIKIIIPRLIVTYLAPFRRPAAQTFNEMFRNIYVVMPLEPRTSDAVRLFLPPVEIAHG